MPGFTLPPLLIDPLTRPHFPAPLLALRTMKAESIVVLPRGKAERLTREDPQRPVNAKRRVLQFAGLDSRG